MKKIVIAIVSFFYCLFGFCQSKVLYLKSKDIIRFQTWDTIYASVKDNNIILTDSKGKSYRLELGVDKNGCDAVIMLSENHYHIHGTSQTYPCRNGSVLMDKKMKLFLMKNQCHLHIFHHLLIMVHTGLIILIIHQDYRI